MTEFKCQACGATFPSQETLMQHAASAHPQPQKQFACKVCGVTFSSESELQAHARSAHAM